MKVGFLQFTSINAPTSLSINLETVLGAGQSTCFSMHNLSKKALPSSVSIYFPLGTSIPNTSSRPYNNGILFQGVEKSISITLSLSSGPFG
jgi:hypothetical protein